MKSINDLTGRQRRYLMWRLVQEAMEHMDARDARRRAQYVSRSPETRSRLAPLDLELPDIGANPLR